MIFVMRKDQFIESADHYTMRGLAAFMIPLAVAFACMLVYWPFQQRFEAFLGDKFAAPTSDILGMLPIVVPFVIAFLLMVPFSRRIQRKMGMPCPHCGGGLECYKPIVVASKNCPHCGMKVLDDSP